MNKSLWLVENAICAISSLFLFMRQIVHISPRGVMDNTEDSGSSAGGSIPSEGAKFKRETLY